MSEQFDPEKDWINKLVWEFYGGQNFTDDYLNKKAAIIRKAHEEECEYKNIGLVASRKTVDQLADDYANANERACNAEAEVEKLGGIMSRLLNARPDLTCPACDGTGRKIEPEYVEDAQVAEHEVPCHCVDWEAHDIAREAIGEKDANKQD